VELKYPPCLWGSFGSFSGQNVGAKSSRPSCPLCGSVSCLWVCLGVGCGCKGLLGVVVVLAGSEVRM